MASDKSLFEGSVLISQTQLIFYESIHVSLRKREVQLITLFLADILSNRQTILKVFSPL
jgi:hypothetical protein